MGHQSTVEKEENNVVKEEKAAGQFGGNNGFGDWDYYDYGGRGRRSSSSSSSSSSSRSSSSSCSDSSESSECESESKSKEKKCPKPKSCPALSIGNKDIGTLQTRFGPVADAGRVFIQCSSGLVLRDDNGTVQNFVLRCKDGKYQPRVSPKTLSELRCEADTQCAAPDGFFQDDPEDPKQLPFKFYLNDKRTNKIGKQPRGATVTVFCDFNEEAKVKSEILITPSSISPAQTNKPVKVNYLDSPDRFTMTCDETGQWKAFILQKFPVVTGILSKNDSVVCRKKPD